jgi:hypothetical protein
MSRFAKGLIKSPHDYTGLGHPHYLTAAPLPPAAAVSLPAPLDQGDLGSCTGNASALAIQVEMGRALPKEPLPELPSRLFLYYNARQKEGTEHEDSGAMISDIFDAAAHLGFPRESAWSYPNPKDSRALLNKATQRPDWMVYSRAADQRIVKGVYRLATSGQELADDIARAIAAGQVVVWGTDLDQAFEDLGPGDVWPGVTGPAIGGHAMVLHEYRTVHVARQYRTRSSWDEWCDGGSAWIAQAAVTSQHASEFFVVALVESYSEVA